MSQQTQEAGTVLYDDRLNGGCHWSMIMRKGTSLRLIDEQGGANVGMLFYNPVNMLERYNAPDTLKCQHTFKLTKGNCLYSDMGRIFCSIVEDSVGWHETVCGNITKQIVRINGAKKVIRTFIMNGARMVTPAFWSNWQNTAWVKKTWRPT